MPTYSVVAQSPSGLRIPLTLSFVSEFPAAKIGVHGKNHATVFLQERTEILWMRIAGTPAACRARGDECMDSSIGEHFIVQRHQGSIKKERIGSLVDFFTHRLLAQFR